MTTTSNIFVGITAWAPSTSYSVGNRRSNGGNAYQCTKAGTSASSGGPSGTGSSITDGAATWKFLASVDYVTVASWASGIPGTLTQPVVGQLWDCGAISTTAGTEYFHLSGHTTSSTNTITLKAAPGESFRDFLTSSSALAFNSSNGVRFVLPSTEGDTNYITVSDPNVIFDGLQFQDPISTSGSSIIAVRDPADLTINHCIFDGYSPAGGSIFDLASRTIITNSLIVDRQGSGGYGITLGIYGSASSSKVVNSTIIAANPSPTNGGAFSCLVGSCYVRNCAIFGYNPLVYVDPSSVSLPFDHCGTDASSLGTDATDNGGNKLSLTPSSQFVNSSSDWRLKAGSALIVAGVADSTDVPTSDDIAGHTRIGWDPGAWEYSLSASASPSLEVLRCSGQASLTANTDSAQGSSTFSVLRASGTMLNVNGATGIGRVIFLQSVSTAVGQDRASAVCTIGLTVSASAALTEPASATASFFAISASGQASVQNATALADILGLSAHGVADQLGATINALTLSCVATAIPNLLFVGSANIDWRFTVAPLTSSTNASAPGSTFSALRCAATAGQRDLASGRATIPALTVSAAIGSSCNAVVSFFPVSVAVATAGQFDIASGLASIEILALPKPVSPQIETDGISPLFLAADGSGLLLAADVFQANITSQTFGTGLATLPSLSCSAQALQQIFWSGSVSAFVLSASAQVQQIDQASGTAVIPETRAAVTAVQQDMASGTASLERLSAIGSLGQSDAATGSSTIPTLSATGAAQGFDKASATTTALALSATSTAAVGSPVRASASLLGMSASGTVSFVLAASGAATLAISAAVRMGQVVASSGAVSIAPVTASIVANQSMSASGSATIPSVTGSGAAVLGRAAAGVSSFLPMAASGTMLNTVVAAQGVASFFQITASGLAFLHPNITSGSGTINFSASGEMMSEVEAAVLVELEQIVAAHAKLWITPIGYEQGDQIVYWPD